MPNDSKNELVRYFDAPNNQIIEIPRAEIAAGAIQVQFEGVEGLVWALAGELNLSEIKHPPFTGERREAVQKIHATFAEHRELSYDEWEEGFRRDTNPDSEIAVFLHAAEIYNDYATPETTLEIRKEIHKILIACLTTQQDTVWDVLSLAEINREKAQQIIDRYHAIG